MGRYLLTRLLATIPVILGVTIAVFSMLHLVPGDPVLRVADRRVALTGGEYQGRRRMTLTYPALEGARRIIWLVTGAGKREALARLLSGDPAIPAGRVRADRALVVCDREAAPPSGR